MIRIDVAWLGTAPLDMCGAPTPIQRWPEWSPCSHHAYLIANKRANRIKVLEHDGIAIWLATRRLH